MNRFLLDTHVLLWWADSPQRLSEQARLAIASARNFLYVSHASLWELAIKTSTGKLTLPGSAETLVERVRCSELPIAKSHIALLHDLPLFHSDPFDRMLIAQAQAEGLTLITRDRCIMQYDVALLAA